MIKRIMFALFMFSVMAIAVEARLSPGMEIIEKRMGENKTVSALGFCPEAQDMEISTHSGVAVFKSFPVEDNDYDSISIEVVKYPKHGSIGITEAGQFVYKPTSSYSGKDSFEYMAVDGAGNLSQVKTVEIKVSRPSADVYFSDMENHWAHNSAIKMASSGLMRAEMSDGKMYFNPEQDMTRGDFLALSLIMAGYEKDIPLATKTSFADDSMIPQNIKSYVQYAYDKGMISGYDNGDGSVNFEWDNPVSRAEAALIASKILDIKEEETDAVPSYKDASEIPEWAFGAVAGVSKIGIMSGDEFGAFSAEKTLTRAEGAEMICNVAKYVEDKERTEKNPKKEKNIFNLFGLLG